MTTTAQAETENLQPKVTQLDYLIQAVDTTIKDGDPTSFAYVFKQMEEEGTDPNTLFVFRNPNTSNIDDAPETSAYLEYTPVTFGDMVNAGGRLVIKVAGIGERMIDINYIDDWGLRELGNLDLTIFIGILPFLTQAKTAYLEIKNYLESNYSLSAQDLLQLFQLCKQPIFYHPNKGCLFSNWGDAITCVQNLHNISEGTINPIDFSVLTKVKNMFLNSGLYFGALSTPIEDLIPVEGLHSIIKDILGQYLDPKLATELFTVPQPDIWISFLSQGSVSNSVTAHLKTPLGELQIHCRINNGKPYEYVINGLGIEVTIPLVETYKGHKSKTTIKSNNLNFLPLLASMPIQK